MIVEKPMYVLTAQRRGVRRPDGAARNSNTEWVADPDFEKRWPNGRMPDIGVQRSQIAGPLIKKANEYNDAQLRAGFLDFLYVVDVETPVHECSDECRSTS